jgi:hypothetical protein
VERGWSEKRERKGKRGEQKKRKEEKKGET